LGKIANSGHVEVSLKLAHLAQARGIRLGESCLLKRELFVWAST